MNVALIGYGGIAKTVIEHLTELAPDARVSAVLVRPEYLEGTRSEIGEAISVVTDVAGLVAHKPDVIAECASQSAVFEFGEAVLAGGCDLMISSVGALADADLADRLRAAAEANGVQVFAPAGAVGGMDALSAAKTAGLTRVLYRSRKPPVAWRGSPAEDICDLDDIVEPVTFYTGTAREAARDYAKNANVAATVALAGLGFEKTKVELCADPSISANVHDVTVEGVAGNFQFEISAKPFPKNPRTSILAAFSVVRALANRASALVV
tara:strand:+ start:2530 stop:3330 length:801 start_codon:yes stop_codon:yes gene_type:complete